MAYTEYEYESFLKENKELIDVFVFNKATTIGTRTLMLWLSL